MKNPDVSSDYLQNVLLIEIPVVVEFAKVTVRVSELLRIAPGSLIPTNQRASDALTIEANGVPIAKGTVTKTGLENDIQITEILSSRYGADDKRAA